MSKVLSLRLGDAPFERLGREARRLNRSPSAAAALLLEEALRQRDFAAIGFRDSLAGRQAYLQSTRLAVWQVVSLARSFALDVGLTAAYLELSAVPVAAALRYAEVYSDEIETAIEDGRRSAAELSKLIPSLQVVAIDPAAS